MSNPDWGWIAPLIVRHLEAELDEAERRRRIVRAAENSGAKPGIVARLVRWMRTNNREE